MKPLLRLFILGWLLLGALGARAQTRLSYNCDGTFYQTRQVGTTSHLYRVNRNTTPYTTTDLRDLGVLVNSLAYNPLDAYLYALSYVPDAGPGAPVHMYKIGQDGFLDLGVTNLPQVQFAGGAIDRLGHYYVTVQGTNNGNIANSTSYNNNLYRFDLAKTGAAQLNALTLTYQNRPTANGQGLFFDIAINPVDQAIYGVEVPGLLYKIVPDAAVAPATDPATATVTTLTSGTVQASEVLGTAFFDFTGNLFAYSNGATNTAGSGKFYQLNAATGAYLPIGTVDPAPISDGASCVDPDQRIDILKTVGTVASVTTGNTTVAFDVPYTIQIRNTGTILDPRVQISEFLTGSTTGNDANDTGTSFPTAQSITIRNPALTNNGGAALVLNGGFTGVNTGTGTATNLLSGLVDLVAGQGATITFTARVVYANAGAVPSTIQNNTAYATGVSTPMAGVANPGYLLVSGTLVPPGDMVAEDRSNNSSDFPPIAESDAAVPTPVQLQPAIQGTVYEDVNYGGGTGRSFGTANGVGRGGARVELYNSTTGMYVSATTTATDGTYSFTGLNSATTYAVRVVNNSVTSSRSGYVSTLVPVQTYVNGNGSRVGGQNPKLPDAGPNTASALLTVLQASTTSTPQSIATVALNGAGDAGVDFGYNFDTVVNTNDSGQGSLRQFVLNANALGDEATLAQAGFNRSTVGTTNTALPAGQETSIFMIADGQAHPGLTASANGGPASQLTAQGGQSIAAINLASTLTLSGPKTSIDATTQTVNIGDTNAPQLGTGGTVGTASTLDKVNGPEVQLKGTSAVAIGIKVNDVATNNVLRGLAIYGFGNAANDDNNADILVASPNTEISQNVVGTTATSFTDPSATTNRSNADHIRITANTASVSTGSLIANNLIGFGNGNGISVGNQVNKLTISDNEIAGNALSTNGSYDGIAIKGNTVAVTGNLVANNTGNGIDGFAGTGGNALSGNTIRGNGTSNVETSGVRLSGAGNTVGMNVISGNYGAGILATSGTTNSVFSQNSIFGNGAVPTSTGGAASGEVGIDLQASGESQTTGTGPFVTLNDSGDGDNGANGLTNMPVLQGATVRNGNLLLTGFAKAGALLEFFIAAPNPASPNATGANFGQGQTYLFNRTEGSSTSGSADLDGTTGTYSTNVNGFNQGTETGQNRFSFSIPLASLTAAQLAAINATGAKLTATATLATASGNNQGTSEFSGNAPVLAAPVAVNDLTTTAPGTAVTQTVTTNDTPLSTLDLGSVSLNGLAPGSTTAVAVTGGSFAFTSNGMVVFTPTAGFVGIATVPYTVSNTSGTTSNTAFISVEVKGTTFDLATAISSPANGSTVLAGDPVTYALTASNPGVVAATNVVETLQLPAGLTNNGGTVTLTMGGAASPTSSYNNATGLVTFASTSLAAGASQAYGVAISKTPGTGPLTATAVVSGSGGTETVTANNVAVNTVNLTPRYDVATTLTGPITGSTATVTRGNEVTYTVTTANLSTTANSVSPALNVVQTVSLSGNLTGLFVTNGGTYAYNSSTGKTVVTFPALPALPVGQSVTNTISFVAPGADYTAPVATVTAGTASDNAGDLNSPTAGTNNNTAQLNGGAANTTVTTAAGIGTAAAGTATNVYTTITTTSGATVAPGGSITLTITAANAGPVAAAGVQETVALPTGLTFSNQGGGSYNATTGVLTFPALSGTLASGASQPYTITFTAPQQGFVPATATVTTTTTDLVPADNIAQLKVDVGPLTDVATTLAGPAVVLPGETATYTVTTVANGPAPAAGVVQKVSLPAGLTGVTVSNGGTYDATTGVVTFAFAGTLAQGFSQTSTISFAAPAGAGSFSPVASVSTATNETSTANNTAALTTTVTPAADLVVRATGPATAAVGNPVLYVVSTTNNGPAAASGVVPTLQLPAGLTVGFPGGSGAYNSTSGLVTFATVATLASGASVANEVVVAMPDAARLTALAQVTSTGYETNFDNNTANVVTMPDQATTALADLQTTLTPATSTVNAGAAVVLTATFTNAGPAAATNVVPQLVLQPGLTGVVVSDGGTTSNADYDATTGVVTFKATTAALASLASGASLPGTYSVTFNAPATGPVVGVASISSAVSDPALANNTAKATVTVTAQADVTTSLSGPAVAAPGAKVTYAVTTLNSAASASPATSVGQTLTLPGSPANLSVPAGSTTATVGGNTVVTFPPIASMAPGAAGEVTNYVSFTAPGSGASLVLTASVTAAAETNAGNNSATITTVLDNAPVAYDAVNSLQAPTGNSAGPMPISPLIATDADAGQTLTYTIDGTSLPTPAQGTLYVYNGTANVALTTASFPGLVLTAAQAQNLRFDPAAGFVGNAFFRYTATDNAATPLTSVPALYTLPVGADNNSAYKQVAHVAGYSYQNTNVVANVFDLNGGTYDANGAVVKNGLPTTGTNAVVSTADATTLAANGLLLDAATGQLTVGDRTKLKSGTISISVVTTDLNGGTNSVPVSIVLLNPLPVELVAFTAKAVANRDAALAWATASEKNSAYFAVERSFDGAAGSFAQIGQVKGQGTTSSRTAYALTDANVAAQATGPVYYRLRQVDADGTVAYSPVQAVTFAKAATAPAIALYPNPAAGSTRLDLSQLPAGTYQVAVLDMTGRAVLTQTLAAGLAHGLDLTGLASGGYLVQVRGTATDGTAVGLTKRLVKE
ncbi:T9SS type A sorting domain-containing protein [Hymenobacter caeli]|uniref:Repeat protein (TIGR01451 family) n=1 Tax=Hymenobacter caeli TaxID=2735894 RepID=A0ABX2FP45_9BACT|nr:T9SS type A sorting domain-containing protein [Hymenobacter caeli]NRT18633.1 putative repeat protein (TIGR01451 family) [Hymenobacter caeli]